MTDTKVRRRRPADLRRHAERKALGDAGRMPESLGALSPEEHRELLHELRVHQIELEMQNDELRRAQSGLEASRERYFDLYDLAPVGYVTVSEAGLIVEANLTAVDLLGIRRDAAARQPLARFVLPEDQDVYYLHRKRLFETGSPQTCELRMVRHDGSPFWVRIAATLAAEPDGARVCRAVVSDITEARQAGEALHRALFTQDAIFEGSRDAVFISDADSRFVAVNAAASELTGYSAEELLSMRIPDLHDEIDLHAYEAHHDAIMAGAEILSEAPTLRKDGRKVETEFNSRRFLVDGRALMHTTARDVSERRAAEAALVESEERYRDLVESASDLICTHDLGGTLLSVNAAAARTAGTARELLVGRRLRDFVPKARWADLDAYLRAIERDGVATGIMQVVTPAGDVRFWEYRNTLRTEGVEVPMVRGIARDVTEQVLARRALKRSEEKYRTILDGIEESYYEVDLAGNLTFFNDSLCRLLGYSREELTGLNNRDYTDPENAKRLYTAFNTVFRTGEPTTGLDWQLTRRDGSKRVIEASVALRRDAEGEPIGFRGLIRDVTERRRAEEALRKSEQQQRLVLDHLPVGVWLADQAGNIIEANPAGKRIWAGARYVGIPEYGEYRGWWADTGKPIAADEWALARAIRLGETSLGEEIDIECFDGSRKTILNSAVPFRDERGGIGGALVVNEDITERKRAEEALAQSRAQLVQSQKVEAVGRLAGGVAHDFNNILQVLLSLATVLRLKAGTPELAEIVGEIEAHVKRGAGLTQQLLLFSRRQMAEKKRLDLAELTNSAGLMLRRLIPENVRLTVDTTPGRLWVDGDAGQLQQVLMNLAVNAKDAMPGGGTLTVRTHSRAGEAVVEVIDTGHGIDDETRAHLFEPFFTTKEAGNGTGLGLSVVHGIVVQHGGRIEVESAPGEGSCFRVILPTAGAPHQNATARAAEAEVPRGHGERVLVVEDEEGARKGLAELLTILGYDVVAAGSGEEAGALPSAPAPDLLLSDLMLPGIDGAALATALRDRWPGLKVVMMSGYTEDEAVRRGIDEGTVHFLQKPFDMSALARALHAALAGPAERRTS